MTTRTCTLCSLLVLPLFASHARAQLIPVKTAPVAEADQLGFLHLANLAMGGVSIALADTLYDPFNNPAKAARLRRGQIFGSPSLYSLSHKGGDGNTIPLSAFLKFGSTFGSFGGSLQEENPATPDRNQPIPIGFSDLSSVSLLVPHG